MTEAVTIGIDIAKRIFQVHGVDKNGKTVVQAKYTSVNAFNQNIALVIYNGRFGFINTKGQEYFIDR